MSGLTRQLQLIDEGASEKLLKVAFATSDRHSVDQHFGSSRSFAVYGLDQTHVRLLHVSEFGHLSQDGDEGKLAAKLAVLEGCIAVYCRACGASAVRLLLAQGVQPVKLADSEPIGKLLEGLQRELQEGTSTWLARAMQRTRVRSDSRFDTMETEGWCD
jgi:nitrogen fixation protein NifX